MADGVCVPINTAPTVANTIPNQTATAGTAFSYAFLANTFADTDPGDTLTYTATQSDDTALPSWLSFAAATRTFSGTPTAADVGTVSVKVTASDGHGGSVSDTFDIVVSAAANTLATGAPTITGTAQVGQTLTASTTGIARRQRADQPHLHVPVDPGGRHGRGGHLRREFEHLHPGRRRPGHDPQGQGELHRRRQQFRDADQRGDGDRLGGGQHPCDGRADDHRHGAGRARR